MIQDKLNEKIYSEKDRENLANSINKLNVEFSNDILNNMNIELNEIKCFKDNNKMDLDK